MTLSRCESEFLYPDQSCPGHLGKFSSCLDEALYGYSLDYSEREYQTGDSDFGLWARYLSFPTFSEVPLDSGDSESPIVIIPRGGYVLCGDDRGFVWTEHFERSQDAYLRYRGIEASYEVWLDDNAIEDHAYEWGPIS